jgi:hypothetical protein
MVRDGGLGLEGGCFWVHQPNKKKRVVATMKVIMARSIAWRSHLV